MTRVVSLLRGVNVGGHHKIKMDALRALYEELGCEKVRTYIQSGNVVYQTRASDLDRLGLKIAGAIERSYGFHVDVVQRTAEQMRAVVESSPFAGRPGLDPAKLAVTFLPLAADAAARARWSSIVIAPEEAHLTGSELYVYFPNGQADTKFPFAAVAKALGSPGTARNWNTVMKLLDMAEAG